MSGKSQCCSIKDDASRMEDGKIYWERDDFDTCANKITRTGDVVTVKTIYRYSEETPKQVMSISEYNEWRKRLNKSKAEES